MSNSGYTPFPSFEAFAAAAPADLGDVDRAARALDAAREGATPARLERAVEIATRYAAVDTGAIEGLYETNRGFTVTIATQAAAWEAALSERGEAVARSIGDALAGYEFVLDAVTRRTPLSQAWIRQLHEIICRSQDTYRVYVAAGDRLTPQDRPLPRGEYKTMPNSPRNADTGRIHHYAPVEDVAAQMARLVDELASPAFLAAHPVLQSAYAHYAFVSVHPFADGNGRVARALASVFLYRSPGVPLVVFADQKDRYIDALEAADAGRPAPLVAFLAERAVDAVELVRTHLGETSGEGDPAAELSALLGDADASRAADRLGSLLVTALREEFDALGEGVQVRVERARLAGSDPGQAVRLDVPGVEVSLSAAAPRLATATRLVSLWRRGASIVAGGGSEPLQVPVADLVPTLRASARLRVAGWAGREADTVIRDLTAALRGDSGGPAGPDHSTPTAPIRDTTD